jgi:hypothetical protein
MIDTAGPDQVTRGEFHCVHARVFANPIRGSSLRKAPTILDQAKPCSKRLRISILVA